MFFQKSFFLIEMMFLKKTTGSWTSIFLFSNLAAAKGTKPALIEWTASFTFALVTSNTNIHFFDQNSNYEVILLIFVRVFKLISGRGPDWLREFSLIKGLKWEQKALIARA